MTTPCRAPEHLVVGLTGGIGSGKTTVSNRLQELGATVIDTDEISRRLTQPGGDAIADIRQAFGESALLPNGGMNRDYIRDLVFSDPKKRVALEEILHPGIRAEVKHQINQGTTHYFVVVVPLLFEKSGWMELLDEIVVIDCPVQQQINRVIQRNGWPENQVKAVINNQTNRTLRLKGASYVIENAGSVLELFEKIDFVHQKLIKMTKK